MVINIEKTVIRKKLWGLYKAVIFTLIVVVLLIYFDEYKGISKYEVLIAISSLYLLSIIYNIVRDFHYIYFSDESDKIVLRYFSPGVFTTKKNSIEIQKALYAGFEIKKVLFGIQERIVLLQKTKSGIAKYPPVSITALKREEKKKMLQALDKRF